ncbi:MAG: hypothetical protein H7Y17_02215 [Chlorobia bacterium]|nr:hypothetical protein [Fimbriimonadaceae bacterium]
MSPSFLIVRFSAIGDCVMAAYVATAIRHANPGAGISWAVETRCRPILDEERLLDEIVDFPRDQWRNARWSPNTWREQILRFSRLRSRKFDFGIDLQGHSKTAICLRIARPTSRIAAFATDRFARRLNPLAPGDPDALHRVERMLETASRFGILEMPEKPLTPKPIGLESLGLDADERIATISTGAGAIEKQYPANQWQEVARNLVQNGYQVIWLGAKPDPRIGEPGTTDRVAQWRL